MEKPRAIALGFFDGVHIGHKKVIGLARELAGNLDAEAAAVTFDRQPASVISGVKTPLLCTAQERADLIKTAGCGKVLMLPFDKKLKNMTWYEFFRMLTDRLGARAVVCGYNYRFGAGGEGDADKLRKACAEKNVAFKTVMPVTALGAPVSSTRIRGMITEGDVEGAETLLGRPFARQARVTHGKAFGRQIGFPTLNMPLSCDLAVPKCGVYFGRVEIEGQSYGAICNVGPGGEPLCEAHAIGYKGNAYGKIVKVRFIRRMRDMIRFSDPESLRRQLSADLKQADEWLYKH